MRYEYASETNIKHSKFLTVKFKYWQKTKPLKRYFFLLGQLHHSLHAYEKCDEKAVQKNNGKFTKQQTFIYEIQ